MRPRVWIVIAGLITAIIVASAVLVVRRSADHVQQRIVRTLAAGLDSEVTLETVVVGWFPGPSVIGRDLVIRHLGRHDVPPLIVVREFECQTSWGRVFARDLDLVRLEGLEVTIPPGHTKELPDIDFGGETKESNVVIRRLATRNARLTVLPANPKKNPHVFDIFDLAMSEVGLKTPAAFNATLTNPVPFGSIETRGTVGPWDAEDPSATPIGGDFTYSADLSTIPGIAGSLASKGHYSGTIERIASSGETETPDFRIPSLKASALPLATTYDAVIDGTNGDVELTRVSARLGTSRFQATGDIVGTKGIKGKRVRLHLTSTDARMEDVLALTVRTQPPLMNGRVQLDATLDVPQGDQDIVKKIRLDGRVVVKTARFTVDRIQDKVDELSRRGRGRPSDESIENVASDLSTLFAVDKGVATLSRLTYTVSGATIKLEGSYALESGAMNFDGDARLVATASATQTGLKRILLKPFDFLFRKDGAGTLIGLDISGTVDQPKVGVDLLRRKKGK